MTRRPQSRRLPRRSTCNEPFLLVRESPAAPGSASICRSGRAPLRRGLACRACRRVPRPGAEPASVEVEHVIGFQPVTGGALQPVGRAPSARPVRVPLPDVGQAHPVPLVDPLEHPLRDVVASLPGVEVVPGALRVALEHPPVLEHVPQAPHVGRHLAHPAGPYRVLVSAQGEPDEAGWPRPVHRECRLPRFDRPTVRAEVRPTAPPARGVARLRRERVLPPDHVLRRGSRLG